MPYIVCSNRNAAKINPQTEGELNFSITSKCLQFLETRGESYATYNAIIGALECVKLEMYRRKIASYEDTKCKQNGDVY